jgi:hypothetical protein
MKMLFFWYHPNNCSVMPSRQGSSLLAVSRCSIVHCTASSDSVYGHTPNHSVSFFIWNWMQGNACEFFILRQKNACELLLTSVTKQCTVKASREEV